MEGGGKRREKRIKNKRRMCQASVGNGEIAQGDNKRAIGVKSKGNSA